MDLKAYLLSMPVQARESFAARCGTTYGHLRNVAYGKTCAERLAINIDRESGGVVTCESLCPDVDFGYLRGTDTSRSHPSPQSESGPGAKPESPNAAPASTGVPDQTAACPCQAGARKTDAGDAVAGAVHVGLHSGDTTPAYACAPTARRGV